MDSCFITHPCVTPHPMNSQSNGAFASHNLPTQKKIKNNTTYTYYHIYQLRAFFFLLLLFSIQEGKAYL